MESKKESTLPRRDESVKSVLNYGFRNFYCRQLVRHYRNVDKLELRLTKLSIHSIKRKTCILTTLYNSCYAVAPIISYTLTNLLTPVHRFQNLLSFLQAEIHGDCVSEGSV